MLHMKLPVLLKSVLVGIPIGVTFFDSVGYIARVEGVSMQPAFNPDSGTQDYIYLNRWSTRQYKISRGDVISLVSPKDPDQKIIKRVVGLEGDVVQTLGYKRQYVKVPDGHCWVEGDHTGHSMDSNTFGPISLGLIQAKASHIVWPPKRWQRVNSDLPSNRWPVNLEPKDSMD